MSLSEGSRRSAPIEVVEPTLANEAGHCYALFRSLHAAAPGMCFRLWGDRSAVLPTLPAERVELVRHFRRRWRKPMAWWLYRRLLRGTAPILVPTATWFDLLALDFAARGAIAPGRAFLYFHKLRIGPRRARALARLARRQPTLELFGTSTEIVERLRAAGFAQVRQVVPVLASGATPQRRAFRTLLSAGAARADKGFARIVDLVALLARERETIPILVQVSGDHYGRHDEQTAADIGRLRALRYGGLTIEDATPGPADYARQFEGAVCLQPYERAEYSDKMSSITFDALRAGAPVVTVDGTSMARVVRESGAGLVVEVGDADAMLRAVREILRNYDALHARALAAADTLRPQASWAPMIERLAPAASRSQ